VPPGVPEEGRCAAGTSEREPLDVRQVLEEMLEVARRSRPRLDERRDVHADPDHRETVSEKPARYTRPHSGHVKRAACRRPAATRRSRSASARSIAAASSSGRSGSARTAASPAASSRDGCDEATTGTPLAIASTIGMPKPSKRDGYTKTAAPRYRRASSSSSTKPSRT